jgi:hypothetical protein
VLDLESAIKHCEEVAKENDDSAKVFYHVSKLETHPDRKRAEDGYVECKKCADEHRQLAEWLRELKRADTLLKATYNLLNKQHRNCCVLNLLAETVYYDGVECDGNCLMEDIDAWMNKRGIDWEDE